MPKDQKQAELKDWLSWHHAWMANIYLLRNYLEMGKNQQVLQQNLD